MYIESVTLKNFRCHKNRTIEFTQGINGIVGKNGTGKSSIIEAIRFAFTGELDDEKEATLTTGTTDGWVRCAFVLNEKNGVIERHLGVSKVILTYDGKRLIKASDVKELWAELLQIDGAIFNNVIVAKQGEIPLLFTGLSSVREKLFQKVFSVPNTERIRTIIWDKYIKTCPAELLVEDIGFLTQQQAALSERIKECCKTQEELQTRTLDVASITGLSTQAEFLRRCIRDNSIRPQLEAELSLLKESTQAISTQIGKLKQIQEALNINSVQQEIDKHKASKIRYQTKLGLVEKLAQLEKETIEDEPTLYNELAKAEEIHRLASNDRAIYDGRKNQAEDTLRKLSGLVGKDECPLCGQTIQRIEDFIDTIKKKIEAFTVSSTEYDGIVAKASQKIQELQTRLYLIESRKGSIKQIREQLDTLSSVTFNSSELVHLEAILSDYGVREREINDLHSQLLKVQGKTDITKLKIEKLETYTGESNPVEELSLVEQILTVNASKQEELARIALDIARLETEYNTIDQRVSVSIANEAKNAKRTAYFNRLLQLYDLLHVTKFPRLLIESYREVVQDLLLQHIQRFDIPYRPHITEGFKIELRNLEGELIPSVSGGQKVIVGLCLRLALHTLFAQSFPMWIVDEGSTHLDDENEKQYFAMINALKHDTNIKQVIIIDHSNLLEESVDNLIKL